MTTTPHTPAVRQHADTGITPRNLSEAMDYARALAAAGLAPKEFRGQPANVLIAHEIASTLDESTWTVMSELSVIGGRPSFSAKFMRSRVRQAGHRLRESYDETTGVARCVIIRADDPDFEHVTTWDRAKAERHKLWGERHWTKNPELMLKNRALSECVREACYEVMGGVAYTADEVLDFENPVRAEATRQHPAEKPAAAAGSGARSVEEIGAELTDPGLTLEHARDLWKEARAAGHMALAEDITAIAQAIQDGTWPPKDPDGAEAAAAAAEQETLDAEIVEDPAA